MIIPVVALLASVILACLNVGRTWTVALAVFFGWLLLVTVTDWRVRNTAKALDGLLREALGIRRARPDHNPGKEG